MNLPSKAYVLREALLAQRERLFEEHGIALVVSPPLDGHSRIECILQDSHGLFGRSFFNVDSISVCKLPISIILDHMVQEMKSEKISSNEIHAWLDRNDQ